MNRIILVAAFFLTTSAVSAIETPSYTVEKKDGSFEIRNYPEMVAASTKSSNQNSGFRTLFKFITGNNATNQKIAMTSPVFMPASSSGKTQEMMFLIPKGVVSAGVPDPKASSVSIKKVAAGRFAVFRTNGRMDDKLQASMLAQLKSKLKALGIESVGNPMFAGYDAPWKPAAQRRNEVLLRLK